MATSPTIGRGRITACGMRRSPVAGTKGLMSEFSWDLRIARASELAKTHSAASELLSFYQRLAQFQKSVYEAVASSAEHDVSVLVRHFSGLLALLHEVGSPALKTAATELEETSPEERLELLTAFWQHEVNSHELRPEYDF